MLYGLVGADWHTPHVALLDVPGRLSQRVPADAGADDRAEDALRVEPVEQRDQAAPDLADDVGGGNPDIVEEQRELTFRGPQRGGDRLAGEARRIGFDDEQRELSASALLIASRPRHEQEVIAVVHSGDVVLGALDDPVAAVAAGGGRDVVRVRARVWFGQREDEFLSAG